MNHAILRFEAIVCALDIADDIRPQAFTIVFMYSGEVVAAGFNKLHYIVSRFLLRAIGGEIPITIFRMNLGQALPPTTL
jgi:hypothetical protein